MLSVFFFNDTATTEIYTLSLHDALPIWSWFFARAEGIDHVSGPGRRREVARQRRRRRFTRRGRPDRKSTRLNSSHSQISYAVFCLKKNTTHNTPSLTQERSSHSRSVRPP